MVQILTKKLSQWVRHITRSPGLVSIDQCFVDNFIIGVAMFLYTFFHLLQVLLEITDFVIFSLPASSTGSYRADCDGRQTWENSNVMENYNNFYLNFLGLCIILMRNMGLKNLLMFLVNVWGLCLHNLIFSAGKYEAKIHVPHMK